MQDLPSLQQRFGKEYANYLLAMLMLGSTAMILASTSVNVALPAIMQVFAVGRPVVQWLATGFLAAMTTGLLLSTWAEARLGARTTAQAALGLFIITSLLALIATSAWHLIILRSLQGLSAGIFQPLATVLIFRVFSHSGRGAALGIFGLGVMLAPALGPTLSGFLVDAFGWQAVFWLPLPMCLLASLLGQYLLPDGRQSGAAILDLCGLALLALGLFAGLAALAEAQTFAQHGPRLYWLALLGLIGLCGFVWRSWGSRHPLLALHLWRKSGFCYASWVSLALGLGLYGSIYLIPLYLQTVEGFSAGLTGLLLLPAGLLMGLATFYAGRLSDRLSCAQLLLIGIALLVLSCSAFAWLQLGTSFLYLCLWTCVGRIGLGIMFPALTAGSLNDLGPEELSHGASAISFVRQLGGALGINLLTFFLEWRHAAEGADGAAELVAFQQSFLLLAALFIFTLYAAYRVGRQ